MRGRRLVLLLMGAVAPLATLGGGAAPALAEDAIVKLVSGQSGHCLQPVNASAERGAAIVQQPCNGTEAQQWTVTLVASTKVHLVNRSSKLCLDARGKAVNGTPIQQWPCNAISNENWGFGISNTLLVSAVSNSFSHCIATPGAQAGLSMQLRFCDSNPAQVWRRPPG